MKMYIYFDRNGTIKEVINDESIRRGSSDYNKIYCYLEGNPDIDDIWYLQKNPDGTLTNEVSFVDNIVTKAIPYDSHRDMKYFQDFEEYQFYVFTLSSSYLSQNGLVVATIRVAENNTLWALGELTFNVQANIVNSDNDITQSQYDYLLITISSYRSEFNNELDWMKNLLFYYSNNVDITDTLTLTNHYLDKANGNANPDVNSKCTNYIDLSTYTGFLISGHSQYATTLICTYDENKTFLRSYGDGTSAGLTFTDYQFIPQSDEKYVRFSTYQYTQYPLKVVSLGELAPITDKKQDNYLFNKKYVACGDSFTKGDVISSDKVYPYLIAQRNNMRLVNMAHNGSYCHYGENGFTNPNNSYYYQNIPLDADIITIAYGLNEISTPIGTKDSNDNTTIWGAYNEVLGWITTNIPNAKVGIISNDAWMTYDLRNALQEIASYWGVEFLDLKEYGKPFMISGKYSQDGDTNPSVVSQRTTQYCVSSQNGHPNELGHKVRSYIIENFLRGAYGVDNSYTRKETDTKLDLKADKSYTYTKTEVDGKDETTLAGAKIYTDNAINDLRWELGSHTLDVESDTDVAFSKSVPNYTIGCQINSVGGMSYKSENLLVLNDVAETSTSIGLTYSIQDGVITLNGTTTGGSISIALLKNISGNNFVLSAFNPSVINSMNMSIRNTSNVSIDNVLFTSINNSKSITTSETIGYIGFYIGGKQTFTNYQIKPMLVSGSTAPTTYKPYFEGIRDSAVTSVVSKGANLLQLNDVAETTTNGITQQVSNGVITISGTSTYSGNIFLPAIRNIGYVNSSQYTFTIFVNKGNSNIKIFLGTNPSDFNQEPTFSGMGLGNTITTTTKTFSASGSLDLMVYITATQGTTYNIEIKPMLVSGSTTPTEFKSYRGIIETLAIPSAIQNLTGYGRGINDTCYNYIDFDRKVFVQKVGRVDLGTLNWSYNSSVGRFGATDFSTYKKPTDNNTALVGLCDKYSITSWNDLVNNNTDMNIAVLSSNNNIIVRNTNYTSAEAFKNAMSGIYLYYELATPIETDISEYLTTDTLDVEPLGTLEFTNTYSQAVPSDIDYLIEEVKA